MDQQQELAFPFQVLPTEEAFHLFNDIKVRLQGQDDVEISLVPLIGSILVTNERLCYFNQSKPFDSLAADQQQIVNNILNKHGQQKEKIEEVNIQGKSFMFRYKDLVSHGLQGQTLACYLGAYEEEMEVENEEQTCLLELIQQKDNSEIVSIERGAYQIYFDLSSLSKQEQERLFDVFSELATADVEIDEEDGLMDGMITADQIDEEGNIIVKKQGSDDDDEWDDDEEEQQQQQQQQQNGNVNGNGNGNENKNGKYL